MAAEIARQDLSNLHLRDVNRVGLESFRFWKETSTPIPAPISVEVAVTGPASRSGPVSAK